MGFDDLQCGLDATNYLIGLGHRRIAHLMGDLNQASARRRLEGYRQAMAAAGLPVREEDLLAGDYLPLESREAFRPILARPPADRPTALFAANDSSALGVMNFLRESGWELPRDLSVVGVDDTGLAANAIPGLGLTLVPAMMRREPGPVYLAILPPTPNRTLLVAQRETSVLTPAAEALRGVIFATWGPTSPDGPTAFGTNPAR